MTQSAQEPRTITARIRPVTAPYGTGRPVTFTTPAHTGAETALDQLARWIASMMKGKQEVTK